MLHGTFCFNVAYHLFNRTKIKLNCTCFLWNMLLVFQYNFCFLEYYRLYFSCKNKKEKKELYRNLSTLTIMIEYIHFRTIIIKCSKIFSN